MSGVVAAPAPLRGAADCSSDDDEVVLGAPILQVEDEPQAAVEGAPAAAVAAAASSREDAGCAAPSHTTRACDWLGPDASRSDADDAVAAAAPEAPLPAHGLGGGDEVDGDRPSGPTWWDRHFVLQWGCEVTVVHIKLKGLGIGDADVSPIARALRSFLWRMADPSLPLSLEVDLAENELTDRGGVQLIRFLAGLPTRHWAGSRVRILKLYKNQLSDAACEELARLVAGQTAPVDEIHLSHNRIMQRGLVALMVAIAAHPACAYPKPAPGGECPCWVRLEHNLVLDVEGILESLAQEPVMLRVCFAPRNKSGPSCTSYHCSVPSKEVAHVHLFCVREQGLPAPSAGREEPTRLAHEYALQAAAGWPPRSPSGPGSPPGRAAEAAGSSPPGDAARTRVVTLRVDKEHGAGLDLEADPYGFLIAGVDDVPGQDMAEGDVIMAIDGVPLWGDLSEDDLGDAFGSRFADGAELQVARAEDARGRALWRPLGVVDAAALRSSCAVLRDALGEDLRILGARCGVAVELCEDQAAVVLRGCPAAQRRAAQELGALLAFYFPGPPVPSSAAAASSPSTAVWCGEPDARLVAQLESSAAGGFADDGGQSGDAGDGGQGERACDGGQGEHDSDGGQGGDLGDWETSLRRQCVEDDDLFDEDLPCEPLEAPDDGPDMFEGEFTAPQYALDRPLQILVLVGLPGAGKSTLAGRLRATGWTVINQDTLGDRRACVSAARKALAAGRPVVIDRCNVSRTQRRVWLGLADDHGAGVGCIWLDLHPAECGRRVLERFNHPTLPATSSSLKVIDDFSERLETPMEAEGFVLWRVRQSHEIDAVLAECQELFEVGGSGGMYRDGDRGDDGQWDRPWVPDVAAVARALPSTGFTYKETRGRGWHAQHLRAVRRQVEYYFSDRNLIGDWFFQEKIESEPESGWLEVRWILSCPRIRDVHRASLDDLLEALGPSNLLVKEAAGTHWVRRGRKLPALLEPRPERGEEPEWYRALHDGAPAASALDEAGPGAMGKKKSKKVKDRAAAVAPAEEPTVEPMERPASPAAGGGDVGGGGGDTAASADDPVCAMCGRGRPRDCFTKAQLTRNRRSPTCKDCIASRP